MVVERRKTKRFSVRGEVRGRVILSSDCDIRDLSTSGMRFMARRRLLPSTRVRIHLGQGDSKLVVHAQVMRSSILSTGTDQDGEGPLYEVAVAFEKLEQGDVEALAALVDESG
jgi:hypothetical protein